MTNQQKGLDFEKACFLKLAEIGFANLQLTKATDNGADIVGDYNGTRYAFQCKNHIKNQGNKCVQEVVVAMRLYSANRCVVISTSAFTPSAIALAKANNCILLYADDFFKFTDFPPENYSNCFRENYYMFDPDYDIIEEYEKVKRSLGRTPKGQELGKSLSYQIRKKYKNYGNFLSSIGDVPYTQTHTGAELRQEYLRVRNLLNKVPTLGDLQRHSRFRVNEFKAYPITKLQKECGDRPHIQRGVSKDQLIDSYLDLEMRLKRPPTVKEIDELCEYKSSYYRRRWGSIDLFLQDIGKTRTAAGLTRRYSEGEILLVYTLIKMLLSVVAEQDDFVVNHTVLESLTYKEKCIISPSTISKKFGGWSKFIALAGEKDVAVVSERMIQMLMDELN